MSLIWFIKLPAAELSNSRRVFVSTRRTSPSAGALNGEHSTIAIKKYAQIKRPSSKYVFVERADFRSWNIGFFLIDPNPKNNNWIDVIAIWHNKKSTLGFYDGHAETHGWLDSSTLKMATAAVRFTQFT